MTAACSCYVDRALSSDTELYMDMDHVPYLLMLLNPEPPSPYTTSWKIQGSNSKKDKLFSFFSKLIVRFINLQFPE